MSSAFLFAPAVEPFGRPRFRGGSAVSFGSGFAPRAVASISLLDEVVFEAFVSAAAVGMRVDVRCCRVAGGMFSCLAAVVAEEGCLGAALGRAIIANSNLGVICRWKESVYIWACSCSCRCSCCCCCCCCLVLSTVAVGGRLGDCAAET